MALFSRQKRSAGTLVGLQLNSPGVIVAPGYHSLADAPEVAAAVWRIADMIASMPIHLMQNKSNGDVRIRDALARKVDVEPWSLGTRHQLIGWIVATMIQKGNAFVLPVTSGGALSDLWPMPDATIYETNDSRIYCVEWKGYYFAPDEVLHFRLRPDLQKPWRGLGPAVQLQPIVDSIMQTAETKRAYMSSEYKPPIIVSVNSDSPLSDPKQRKKFSEQYLKRTDPSEPLVIPADLMTVTQVKPLSLTDLAIKDGIELDKRDAAALVGVPGYMVGVGAFNKEEYNTFISSTLLPTAQRIEQELTKKLLMAEDRYFLFHARSLYSYDMKELSSIGENAYVRGLMTGNEVRNWLQLPPRDGLDKLVMLENFIPADRIGDQTKLDNKEDSTDGT